MKTSELSDTLLQELCEERIDGAERQGALGTGDWRMFVLTICPFQRLRRGGVLGSGRWNRQKEEAKQVRGRALVQGRSQKPARLTLTTRQEKYRVLVKTLKLGFRGQEVVANMRKR